MITPLMTPTMLQKYNPSGKNKSYIFLAPHNLCFLSSRALIIVSDKPIERCVCLSLCDTITHKREKKKYWGDGLSEVRTKKIVFLISSDSLMSIAAPQKNSLALFH